MDWNLQPQRSLRNLKRIRSPITGRSASQCYAAHGIGHALRHGLDVSVTQMPRKTFGCGSIQFASVSGDDSESSPAKRHGDTRSRECPNIRDST